MKYDIFAYPYMGVEVILGSLGSRSANQFIHVTEETIDVAGGRIVKIELFSFLAWEVGQVLVIMIGRQDEGIARKKSG